VGKRKKKKPSKFVDYTLYLLLRTLSTTLHCFPLTAAMRFAAGLGDVMYVLDGRHRRRSMENLRACFPEKSERELKKLTRDSFRLLPMLGVEVMLTPRYVKLQRLSEQFILGHGLGPVLRLLVEQKSGAVMVTGHYGNWEVLGYMMAVMGFETTSVARPLDNKYINRFVLGVREEKGQRIIDKKGAMREAPAVLEKRGAMAFIADQDAGPKGMFVDFFGRPASTYKSIGLLAMRYNVPVVVGFARRMGYDFRFRLDVQDVIWPADWASQRDPLRYITQRYTKAIEDTVRGEPGQYLWLHRRWKSRPREELEAATAAPVPTALPAA
jgi:KDO2-lipid IV(A) lauroyltransferase